MLKKEKKKNELWPGKSLKRKKWMSVNSDDDDDIIIIIDNVIKQMRKKTEWSKNQTKKQQRNAY